MDMKDTQTTSTGVKPPSEFWKQTKSGRWYYDGDFAAYQQLCSEADSVWHDAKATK